jgi:hypothetical protein
MVSISTQKGAKRMKNSPILLRTEQETAQKPIYKRMKGEPACYFLLFRYYCEMGRKRSLQALWEQEHPVSGSIESDSAQYGENDTSTPTVRNVSRVSDT